MRTNDREPNPDGLLPVFLCLYRSTWRFTPLEYPPETLVPGSVGAQIQMSFCAVRSVMSLPVFNTPLGSISISFTSRSA